MALNTYPTKLIEAFAAQALEIFYQEAVAPNITNNDYEGEVKDKSSILNVMTFGAITSHNYTGADMTADSLTESSAQLTTDQAKSFYFKVKNWDTFRSYVKNPENTIIAQVGREIKKVVDIFVLGLFNKVGAGNRDGTDYVTGTVSIDAAGNVTGVGTTFTSGMVAKGFKATGHTKWYRVKTFSSTTAIVVENDSDDLATSYDGGVITGATFNIQGNTALTVTKATIYARITQLKALLDDAEIPAENRFLVVPPTVAALIRQAPEYVGVGSESGRESVQNGLMPGQFSGFDIYMASSARIGGDSVNGYHCLGGHKSAICFAMGLTENQIEEQLIANFGKGYKSLYVYGAKVPDERRKALVDGFWLV